MISVIIPVKKGRDVDVLSSLGRQTFKDLEIIILEDEEGNPSKVRNIGFKKSCGEFVLFCDCDLELERDFLECLFKTLTSHPDKSYSYCAFEKDGVVIGNTEFSPFLLKENNFINVCSLIRREDFIFFDENLIGLEDWDLYLSLLEQDKVGVFCGKVLFKQFTHPDSVTNTADLTASREYIRKKHNL